MTTPIPNYRLAGVAPDGAVTIGGGTWNYGQTVAEQTHRAGFELEQPTPSNMLDLLRVALEMLPVEALKPWAGFLGFVDGVFTSIGEAADAIIGSLVEHVTMTVQAFEQWVHDFFQALGSGLQTIDLQDLSVWFHDTVLEPVAGTIDGFVRGILGLVGSGFNVGIVEQTAVSLADAIASMNAAVTRLDRQAEAGRFSGTAVFVDFANQAPGLTLGPDWDQFYSGTGNGAYGVTSGRGKWSGSADYRVMNARYVGADATSNYQKVGAAFATVPSTNFFGGWKSRNRLIARANADLTTFVYVDFEDGLYELGCYVNGAKTVFKTQAFKFRAGEVYWLEAGVGAGVRTFRVWQGNQIIGTPYVDGALVSELDHFSAGLGVMAATSTYVPAQTTTFAFFDNTPAQITGIGWRVSRVGTASYGITASTELFPAGYFDTVDYMSSELTATYDAAQNKVTAPYDGWYLITVVQHGDLGLGLGVGGRNRAVVFRNGVPVSFGGSTPANINVGYNGFSGSFSIYCQAGDEIQPGYDSSWAINNILRSSDGGLSTWWSGVYLGKE